MANADLASRRDLRRGTLGGPLDWKIAALREFGVLRVLRLVKKEMLRGSMPCVIVILIAFFPRIVLIVLFLTSNYLERAYHGLLLPLLGFIFLPLTTLSYAWMVNTGQPVQGVGLVILVVAIVVDLGGIGGGEYHRRRWL